jgi:hypothetical protein
MHTSSKPASSEIFCVVSARGNDQPTGFWLFFNLSFFSASRVAKCQTCRDLRELPPPSALRSIYHGQRWNKLMKNILYSTNPQWMICIKFARTRRMMILNFENALFFAKAGFSATRIEDIIFVKTALYISQILNQQTPYYTRDLFC